MPKRSKHSARSRRSKEVRRSGHTLRETGRLPEVNEGERHAKKRYELKKKILSLPGLIALTALTAAVGWAVNYFATLAATPKSPPISATVMADPAKIPFFSDFSQNAVLPNSRDIGTPGRGCNGFHNWMLRNKGVPTAAQFQLVIQSDTSKAVLVEDMRVRMLRELPELNGPAVSCPSAGHVNFRPININLDSSPPTISYRINNQSAPFGFTLSEGETEVFDITASSRKAHYIFDIQLNLVIGGQPQTLIVTDNGQPFAVSATKATKEWEWNYGKAWDLYGNDFDLKQELLGGEPFPPGT